LELPPRGILLRNRIKHSIWNAKIEDKVILETFLR